MHEKYKDQGLVVLGVSDEPSKLLDDYVEKNNVAFPVVSAPKGMTAYGVRAFPTHVLVSASGRVITRSRPSEEQIEAALKSVVQFPKIPGNGGKLGALRKACAKNVVLAVAKALPRVEQDDEISAQEKGAVETTRKTFNRVIDTTLAEIKAMKGPDYFANVERLEELEKKFKGLPVEADAKTRIAEFKNDKKIKREITAMKSLRTIRDRYDLRKSSNKKKIRKALAGLIKKYPGTLAADKAQKQLYGS